MTQLYSYQGNYPQSLPDRIRLSNGFTKTDKSTFTESDIADAGFILVSEKPIVDESVYRVDWNRATIKWDIVELSADEKLNRLNLEWSKVREKRNDVLNNLDKLAIRQLEVRGKVDSSLLEYKQKLRDLPQTQKDPFNIEWPSIESGVLDVN